MTVILFSLALYLKLFLITEHCYCNAFKIIKVGRINLYNKEINLD